MTKERIWLAKEVLICCDDVSAVNFAGNKTKYKFITAKIPDFDILQGIRKAMEQGTQTR
jgi:hypothetical protein